MAHEQQQGMLWQLRFSMDSLIRQNSSLAQANFWLDQQNQQLQAELVACQKKATRCLVKEDVTKEIVRPSGDTSEVKALEVEIQRLTDKIAKLKSELERETNRIKIGDASIKVLSKDVALKNEKIKQLREENKALTDENKKLGDLCDALSVMKL